MEGRQVAIAPLREGLVSDVREGYSSSLPPSGGVVQSACANIASLLLARASGRQREMAVRARSARDGAALVRQLITESLLLATSARRLGLLAGTWAIALVDHIDSGRPPPRRRDRPRRPGRAGQRAITYASAVLLGLSRRFRRRAPTRWRLCGRPGTLLHRRAQPRANAPLLVVGESRVDAGIDGRGRAPRQQLSSDCNASIPASARMT